jgi:hypothetical protein
MWFFQKVACNAALSQLVEHHSLWLVFFGLALAAFDFLDGFIWLRSGFLGLRALTYAALHPSIRPLSGGDYWLISVILLVAALCGSVATFDVSGAPIRFFIYATAGLVVIVRLYVVVYAIEKRQLSRPPQRTADRLLARLSTERAVSPAYAGRADNDKSARARNVFHLPLIVPLTYLWQTLVALASILMWAIYAPIVLIALTPGKLLGFLGLAIATAPYWLPRTCS